MNPSAEGQPTTEGKLLCGAIIIAGLFEEGRLQVADPTDASATNALREVLAAMHALRAEAANWPDATH